MPTIYDNDVLPFTSESLINSLQETQPHLGKGKPVFIAVDRCEAGRSG